MNTNIGQQTYAWINRNIKHNSEQVTGHVSNTIDIWLSLRVLLRQMLLCCSHSGLYLKGKINPGSKMVT